MYLFQSIYFSDVYASCPTSESPCTFDYVCMRQQVPMVVHVCVSVHEDHRRDAIIEGPPADFTQSTWPHWR